MKNNTIQFLHKIRETAPLIHNITNYVVMNSSANILLALGASPVMAHSSLEVEQMASYAGALVLNIGTLEPEWIDSMILAAKIANARNIPIILDPVGSGATSYRTETVKRIMNECKISVIRGNASEVFSIVSDDVKTKGVDSTLGMTEQVVLAAKAMAKNLDLIVAVSGEIDTITDGKTTYRVGNGHQIMTRVTGVGCGLTAVVGAFCAVSDGDILKATTAAFGTYALCGDIAVKISEKPASFFTEFVDNLYTIDKNEINNSLNIWCE